MLLHCGGEDVRVNLLVIAVVPGLCMNVISVLIVMDHSGTQEYINLTEKKPGNYIQGPKMTRRGALMTLLRQYRRQYRRYRREGVM